MQIFSDYADYAHLNVPKDAIEASGARLSDEWRYRLYTLKSRCDSVRFGHRPGMRRFVLILAMRRWSSHALRFTSICTLIEGKKGLG